MTTAMVPLRRNAATKALEDDVLRCVALGNHAWEDFNPIDLAAPQYGWRLSLRCVRCLSERHDVIDSLGRVSQRRYRHSDMWKEVKHLRKDMPRARVELGYRIKRFGSTESMFRALWTQ